MEMPAWLLLTFLVVLAIASPRYGVDSRLPPAGEPAAPRHRATVRGDVAALVRAVRQGFHPVLARADALVRGYECWSTR
ncbi:hypothetical protein, partial [Pseudonocardia sp.]|uniref:hypothetical protein n=1 Tax=Pseudonocardia sp. TaxID=60912 RepID=UPI0031FC37BF